MQWDRALAEFRIVSGYFHTSCVQYSRISSFGFKRDFLIEKTSVRTGDTYLSISYSVEGENTNCQRAHVFFGYTKVHWETHSTVIMIMNQIDLKSSLSIAFKKLGILKLREWCMQFKGALVKDSN